MKLIFSKSTPLGLRLFLSLILSVALIICDVNYRPFTVIRYYLDSAISPLYYVSNFPLSAFNELNDLSAKHQALLDENVLLKEQLQMQQSDLVRLDSLKKENDELRTLLGSPLRNDEYKKVAQVLLVDTNPYSYQITLDKGTREGVFIGQPVVDEKGVVGQIFKTAYNTSRAILICDSQHAIPVQVLRNGITMVAVGNGCNNDLLLDFLPNNVDIQVGDVLVTSGLGGRFPKGYPVATVSSVKVDMHDSTPVISATPTADLKRLRYLLLLWNEHNKSQAVTPIETTQEISSNE
ncbi:rod shape-determining protein MreC [Frischella perrara]|uniref:Cell shape-determining protein MreC n=1 Tax=Frischella perrara TaxID=1267021 RepID=A0A0A7S3J5_FRIPE|nr:rod shape-determining protein MreC [Frischella perrara]AJA46064.1 rod shape-determining protein MreC [Frischella perrara]MCT6875010.1 rod shape-determining protein MreC [Frischella perrara]PWV61299.1 rod shape-determining protein MreC [Frischella perrara]PXY94402.1 rod shape-determining protein MreC [Frischella perrara]